MSRQRLTVVLSQAQGKHPAKRALEESIVAALIMEPGLDVSVVPNLYDLGPDHTGRLFLESVKGDMVVLRWLYPRAAFWLLDRDGIKGHFGETQLKPPSDDDEDDEEDGDRRTAQGHRRGELPDRHIYCLDLRDFNNARAVSSRRSPDRRRVPGTPRGDETRRRPASPTSCNWAVARDAGNRRRAEPRFTPEQLLAAPERRWYPVIDYSRCTNCMECLDFCLFGVYGVD